MKYIILILIILMSANPVYGAKKSVDLVLTQDINRETDPSNTRPDYCMNEDDRHFRQWSGGLSQGQTFFAIEQFCDLTQDGITAGGVGVRFTVWSKSLVPTVIVQPSPQSQEVNWPDPEYPYPDVPGLELIRNRGQVITSSCIVPAYHTSNDRGVGNLEGGIYNFQFTNNTGRDLRDLRIEIEVRMARSGFQTGWCPIEYQNLLD